ncbi:MAG: pentapeptide repeat-containing protein [Chloroflexota bacterium]|nr:pentapeptide repeat-containing protein [Chloroflexota bacterium]
MSKLTQQAENQPPASAEELLGRYSAGQRHFSEVDLPAGSNLRNSTLDGATFDHGWLSEIDFSGANLRHVSFLHCNVKCSDFRGANLEGAIFRGSLVEATYFDAANLTGVSFVGASAYGYELKDGDMPDAQGQL